MVNQTQLIERAMDLQIEYNLKIMILVIHVHNQLIRHLNKVKYQVNKIKYQS